MSIPEEARLHHLSAPTQSKLRSTQILTSLPQVVSELVQNSLDAGAGHVETGVDCEEWMCWVRDDGHGMSKSDLHSLLVAGRYGTSKAYAPASLDEIPTFGFRGEALASVSDLCCLEISSRTRRSRESWSVIVRGGDVLYDGPSIRWRLESSGTVVSVKDTFYNLPVRRRSHPSPQRTLELIRKGVESLALVFPSVSFSLENTTRSGSQGKSDRGRVMAVPKESLTSSTLQAFRHLFGRALVERVDEIHEVFGDITLDGFISLEGAPSKAYQYLCEHPSSELERHFRHTPRADVNRHILVPCDLHRIIDVSFASSSFARHALDEYLELSQPLSSMRHLSHPIRKVDKKPMYVLNITVPAREVDNCVDPAKTTVHLQNSDAVHRALASVVESFLVRHGFKAQATPRWENRAPPRKKRKLELSWSAPNFGAPEGSRSGRAIAPLRRTQSQAQSQSKAPVIVPPDDDIDTTPEDEGELIWTDPRTGEVFAVDRRTGNSYPVKQKGVVRGVDSSNRNRRTLGPRPPSATVGSLLQSASSTQDGEMAPESDAPEWIREVLNANDTFALQESSNLRIPALELSAFFANDIDDWHKRAHEHRHATQNRSSISVSHAHQSSKFQTQALLARFSKAGLKNARVLGQVDRKFIACVLPALASSPGEDETGAETGTEEMLVLVDQHAAHERVRVERFLDELCSGSGTDIEDDDGTPTETRCRILDSPVNVLLTRHEAELLAGQRGASVRGAFEAWGVKFGQESLEKIVKLAQGDVQDDSGYAQVEVESVPAVVASKLMENNQLRDLVKSYIAEMVSSSCPDLRSLKTDMQFGLLNWQHALRWCPRDLLDLVNSKACRGAIMFNDMLSLDRCERLVRELSDTALPFQCAHGRPSLAPLASLGGAQWSSRHVGAIDWRQFGREDEQ